MKDGTVFEGVITEKNDNTYKIRTSSGRELIFQSDQVRKISSFEQGEVNLSDYGRSQALGISLLGQGLLGGHFRQKVGKELFLDLGLHYTPLLLFDEFNETSEWSSTAAISGSLNFFVNRFYKERKQKVRANGFFLNASYDFGNYDATSIGFGWASEYFRRDRFDQSFLLELGPAIGLRHWVDDPSNFPFNYNQDVATFEIHIRLVWVFHVGKK